MVRWSRKPTEIGGETVENDWCVLRDGIALGRVHLAPYVQDPQPFTWSSWTHPAQSGYAETLEEALEKCRRAIGSLPVPPEIERQIDAYRKS